MQFCLQFSISLQFWTSGRDQNFTYNFIMFLSYIYSKLVHASLLSQYQPLLDINVSCTFEWFLVLLNDYTSNTQIFQVFNTLLHVLFQNSKLQVHACSDFVMCCFIILHWVPSIKQSWFHILGEITLTVDWILTTKMCKTLSQRRLCEVCAW